MVELHGGEVQAESPGFGQGATFTVTLPLMKATQQRSDENVKPEEDLMLEGVRVLVVDDDTENLELIVFILEQHSMEVRAVKSAKEALAVFTQWQPDLLLSDIGMPEVDGYTLIRQIRALPKEQGGLVSAIALTAYAGDNNRQQVLSAGFQEHVSKPVDPTELVLAIARVLQS